MSGRVLETSRQLRSIVTRHSRLPGLAEKDSPAWQAGWLYLSTLYQPAMVRYVRRLLARTLPGVDLDEEATDVVQSYMGECIEKGWLAQEPESVRCFRAWLQHQLKRYVNKHVDARRAQKRDPGRLASEEALLGVAGKEEEAALDEGWVAVAIQQSIAEMRSTNEDYAEIIQDLLRTEGEGSPDLAARLGKTEQQVVHLRHRARKRFANLFHEHLRETVRDEEAFEALCLRLAPYLP